MSLLKGVKDGGETSSYYEAIREAIDQEMARDPSVFLMGEDVGAYGGIFWATQGLLQKYGPERVRDTPISEAGFIGAALGAATIGMRPYCGVNVRGFPRGLLRPNLQSYSQEPLSIWGAGQTPYCPDDRHRWGI